MTEAGLVGNLTVWIYSMTSARLDATDQFPCQEPVDKKLAHNWSLCMKIVHQFNKNYWLATYLIQYAQPELKHSNEQMNAWRCCLRNITCNFQNSATKKCDYPTDRCQTKWSLCASLLRRRPELSLTSHDKSISLLTLVNNFLHQKSKHLSTSVE